MPSPRRKSILRKLTLINMLVSGAALILACLAFFTYDQFTFRQSLVHMLSAQADIVGSNSVSAILFNDPQSASNTLSALKSSQSITSAGIFTLDGRKFASFTTDSADNLITLPPVPEGKVETYRFGPSHLTLVRKIIFQGNPVGLVFIRADLKQIDLRLKRYAAIALAVLLLSLIAALLVSALFGRSLARPIVDLAKVAATVSQEKTYSARATPSAEADEVGLLITAFNEMLAEIQRRDEELRKAHDELEDRVTQRTRELSMANRELEAFSYSVSHDLRGPVDALNGFTYVLLKEYGDKLDAKAKELLQHIRGSGRRMIQLIDDLLNLSRVTSSALQAEPVDLSAIARSIADDLVHLDPNRKVEFVIPKVDRATGDPRLLRIVLDNLLRNAWKYASAHETARIEFGSVFENERTVYFVRDDGAGFDPRSADRLFQPFQRLHPTAEFPGNGIGLATVQRIIRRHGGEIWASAAVEQGATFYFWLPAPRSRPSHSDEVGAKEPLSR
ncbi:MAG: ATP-binding protein [Candidatus Sulfotelmatobacter sp.]|jgi:signal transduction histidine kinase